MRSKTMMGIKQEPTGSKQLLKETKFVECVKLTDEQVAELGDLLLILMSDKVCSCKLGEHA